MRKNGRLWRTWAKNCNNFKCFFIIYMVRGNSVSLIYMSGCQSASLSVCLFAWRYACVLVVKCHVWQHACTLQTCTYAYSFISLWIDRLFFFSNVATRDTFSEKFQQLPFTRHKQSHRLLSKSIVWLICFGFCCCCRSKHWFYRKYLLIKCSWIMKILI